MRDNLAPVQFPKRKIPYHWKQGIRPGSLEKEVFPRVPVLVRKVDEEICFPSEPIPKEKRDMVVAALKEINKRMS